MNNRNKIALVSSGLLAAVALSFVLHAADRNTSIFISDFEPPGSSMFDFEAQAMSTALYDHEVVYALNSIESLAGVDMDQILLVKLTDMETSASGSASNNTLIASVYALSDRQGLQEGGQVEAESIVLASTSLDVTESDVGQNFAALGSSWEFL